MSRPGHILYKVVAGNFSIVVIWNFPCPGYENVHAIDNAIPIVENWPTIFHPVVSMKIEHLSRVAFVLSSVVPNAEENPEDPYHRHHHHHPRDHPHPDPCCDDIELVDRSSMP